MFCGTAVTALLLLLMRAAFAAFMGDPLVPKKAFLVVQAYGTVTNAMEELFIYYSRELRNLVDVWVLYDPTCRKDTYMKGQPKRKRQCLGSEESKAYMQRLKEIAAQERFHALKIDDRTLSRRYPMMRGLQHSVFGGEEPAYANNYYGVMLWLRFMVSKGLVDEKDMGYIWTVEDDSLYAGHIRNFIQVVMNDPSNAYVDYLAPQVVPMPSSWAYRNASTFPISVGNAWIADEFVTRSSPRLLITLERMLLLNVVTHGQAFAATICHAVDWCHFANFTTYAALERRRDKQGSEDCWFGAQCSVSQEQFNSFLADPDRKEQWYHANEWMYDTDAKRVYAALPPLPQQ